MSLKNSLKIGLSFGLTSGVITTLGMIIGLNAGTSSRLAVIGGIITIAIADALSDSLGIHISQESQNAPSKQVWLSTFITFLTKFTVASSFIIPFLLFPLNNAIIASIGWGLLLLTLFSYNLAIREKGNPAISVFEHLLIAILVIATTDLIGNLVAKYFI